MSSSHISLHQLELTSTDWPSISWSVVIMWMTLIG